MPTSMGRATISGAQGKHGRAFFNGTELCITEWSLQEIAEEDDTTNSCSAGYDEYEYGNVHLEGSITADWDADYNSIASVPNLRAGTKITDVKLYINATSGSGNEDGPYSHMPSCGINNVSITVPAKGKVSYTCNVKSDGEYTFAGTADVS